MNWRAGVQWGEEGLWSEVCRLKVEREAGKALASRLGLALRLHVVTLTLLLCRLCCFLIH